MTFSAEHLDVRLAPSLQYCGMLVAVHGLALVALFYAGLEPWFSLALATAVVASLAYSLRRFGLLWDPSSVVGLRYERDRWVLDLRSGLAMPGELESDLVVLGWLVVMNFRDAKRRHYPVTVLRDSTPPDQFRRLRVLLRHYPNRGGTR